MTLILGIDDAGRGPIIGPMALAGVLLTKPQETILKEKGVKDSKQLTPKERQSLAKEIKANSKNSSVILVSPNEIDQSLATGVNLNTLEAIKIAEVINLLNNKKEKIEVVVDCPSVNTKAWASTLLEQIEHPKNLAIKCEHKADENHPSVSSASILAKEAREQEVTKLKKKYGDIGSGYPADPNTQKFLNENGIKLQDEGIIRKSWATWKKHVAKQNQKSLLDY